MARTAHPVRRSVILSLLAVLAAAGGVSAQTPRPGQPPTNTDEAQVRSYSLPDPLRLTNGEPVTDATAWREKRRPEIMRLLAEHQFGRTPTGDATARYDVIERDAVGLHGLAKRTQVRIRFNDAPDGPSIRVLHYVPATSEGPVPTLLHLGFSPAVLVINDSGLDEGMAWDAASKSKVPDRQARRVGEFNARYFVERGYGVAYVYYGDIEGDFDGAAPFGVRGLFGADEGPRRAEEWGSIGAWAWGLSRVRDWLDAQPNVDPHKVALSGVSRLGKAVLWAGAQDEGFDLVIPLLSGEGGAAISRRNFGETIADLTNPDRFDYWYAPQYDQYAFDVDANPVDGHMLLAMIAPRPLLQITGATDTWSDPKGEWISAQAAAPVWALLGKTPLPRADLPAPGVALQNDMGWYMHADGHTTLPVDFWTMANFMDQHFGKPASAQ